MIVLLQTGAGEDQVSRVCDLLDEAGLTFARWDDPRYGVLSTVGVLEEAAEVALASRIGQLPGVARALRVAGSYPAVSREWRPEPTVVAVSKGVAVGGVELAVIAGPCSVESREQIMLAACEMRKRGADMLRGGAFKPRTSPHVFQGLGQEGLCYLQEAAEATGLPIVTEVMDTRDLEPVGRVADVIQIGSRNMQNFALLKEAGRMRTPILLKRGMSATVDEWLQAAEHIMAGGNPNIILCERGIRTFETSTRNTLDLNAIPVVKRRTHLPIIVDPSHGTGYWGMVIPMSLAAIAAGADGLIVEVHPDPTHALSDGPQSLVPERFSELMERAGPVAAAVGRRIRCVGCPSGTVV